MLSFLMLCNFAIITLLILNQVFLYRTIKKQEAILNQQLKLLEMSINRERIENDQLVQEWQSYVFLQALQVRDAIFKQITTLQPKAIEDAPNSPGLTSKELALAFSPHQIEAITLFWDHVNTYKKHHWRTDHGQIKTVFKGAEHIKGSEVHSIQLASKQLLPILDQLIKRIKGVEH